MGQVIVRNLDDRVIDRLKTKAELHKRSLEQELRTILTEAARLTPEEKVALADSIRVRNPGPFSRDSVDLIREDRDR
jgi:plasmid stability protein